MNKGKHKAGAPGSPGSLTDLALELFVYLAYLVFVCDNLTRCDLGWVRAQGT